MVRSLGCAREAALIGTTPEASRMAPASAVRSRRPHGGSARYSRNVTSGSGGVTWAESTVVGSGMRPRLCAGAGREVAEVRRQHGEIGHGRLLRRWCHALGAALVEVGQHAPYGLLPFRQRTGDGTGKGIAPDVRGTGELAEPGQANGGAMIEVEPRLCGPAGAGRARNRAVALESKPVSLRGGKVHQV